MRLENTFVCADGVGELTERRLWESGVRTWRDFEERRPLGPKTRTNVLEFVEKARERLSAGDATFFDERLPSSASWRLARSFQDSACYFDIETTGLSPRRARVTTVSLHRGGDTRTLVRGRDLTTEALEEELREADVLVSYNGKRFDAPFLEHELGVEMGLPHVDLMYLCRRLGYTGGLKAVERRLGVDRGGVEVTGRDAVRLWHDYEAGDEGALETLVEYNRHDTRNLESVLERLDEEVTRRAFAGREE